MQMRFLSMTDSMKFGPEWLRNLSSERSTSGAPKYQLAEHRYGREEMLALFDENVKAPEPLTKLQGLYVEKTQIPMTLLTMSEEETRQWNKGINSDGVLRLSGKTLPGPPGGGGIRGRGGSIDRGRGRPRGSGGFHYSRGLSYEEQSDGIKEGGPPDRGFSRSIRSYDRSQGVERSWGERNGGDPGDWNGSTSPRKEFSSMKDFSGGGRNSTESWRRHRGTSEEEGWRKSDKWGRSNSWRDESDEGGLLSKSTSRTSSWGRGWADEGLRGRSHDEDSLMSKRSNFVDEVPEWAMENPSESGGSFDATGAFHGGNYSDEEEDHGSSRTAKNRLSEDIDLRNKSKSPPRVKKPGRNDFNDYEDECEEPNSSPKDRKLSRSQTAQGNLSETSKMSSNSLAKSQSSTSLKTDTSVGISPPSKRTESQSFDRIRVQHQNFIDKNGTNKETSDDRDVKEKHNKEVAVEPILVSEEVIKSETSAVLKTGVPNIEKNLSAPKDSNAATGIRLSEELERGGSVNRQGSEEDMERMAEVVKDTVVKLFEDEEKPPVNVDNDKWYYRDPQGVVQGPFRSSEMLEWFMNGYFALSLLVRREQDELYVKLGDLMVKCGKIPFLPGVNLPVLKADAELPQQPPPTPAQPQPHGLSQPDLFMQQYHQYQILQKQFLLSQQLALNKLSQSEMWNTLSSVQQRSLLMQKLALAQQPPVTIDQLAQVDKNPLSQLIAQMQQNKMPIPEVRDTKNVDPVRQLLQHMNVMQASQPPLVTALNPAGVMLNHHLNPQAHLNSVLTNTGLTPTPNIAVEEAKVEDPIQSLLRQLGNQSNIMPPPAPAPTDSLWGAPGPGRPQHWTQSNQSVGNAGGLPLWEIKTEQQILAEQQLRLEEERRQEELRKRKEEEEEAAKKQKELEEKRREEEKREELKKLELKRIEEEKQKQLLKEKEKEEKKKAEELKKKQQEEAQKKKQEMAKKMQEAQKKKEEKEKKKEEEREKKRLLEEGKKKLENEKKKKEEEQQRLKKKQEEEEAAKKEERLKRPIDTLKKMQEMQMERFKKPLPWSQPSVTTTGTSLSDIQKMQEKEKKQQQQAAQMLAQQKEMQQQMQNENRSNGMNLKWAEQMPRVSPSVKSLAEIQAEEQLQLAKQLEKERVEREKQQREAALTSNTGIWGNASQSLTWTSSSTPWGVTPVQNNPTPGFWDEVAPTAAKTKTKTPASPLKGKSQQATNLKPTCLVGSTQKSTKSKSKKEEAAVMKLFERLGDEFTSWCSDSLQSIQSDVDIPTFVSFLRDIESPYEVTEYVKCYLGDGKEAQEFAKQFLERRSRWMSAQKASSGDDDMISSSHANIGSQFQSNATQEFQEVKGKGKKSKKGKMLKVDNRILGFSVTAAPDRINIGDRDYVNHNL